MHFPFTRFPLAFSLVLLTSFVLAADDPATDSWQAGVATVVITPQEPMWMAGYASRDKPSEGTLQELFAKALAIQDPEGHRVVVVTLDLIGVLTELRESVAARVEEDYGLPPAALMLNASHTHCGPEYRQRAGREEEARAYQTFLEQTLVTLVGQALDQLAPAELARSRARAGFAMNRRLLTPQGYQIRPNPDGPVDHEVPVLMATDPQGDLRAVLFGYACHNTTLSFYQFCGDYAGYAQEYFEADYPGTTALFVTGCGADQNPHPRREVKYAQQHGRTLATAVEAAVTANPQPLQGQLRYDLDTVLIDRASGNQEPFPYPIQVFQFGDGLTLIALASEVVVDYSLRLKEELAGDALVWVAGYSNGYFGYIPSRRILEEGGYEAGRWEPSIEDRIIGKVHEMVGKLRD